MTAKYQTNAVIEFNIYKNHPFTIVEEPHFVKFTKSLRQEFCPGTAKKIKTIIMKMYFDAKQKIVKSLNHPGNWKVSATTDMLTSEKKYSMMAVTLTWISKTTQ